MNNPPKLKKFRVKVGHAEVSVECMDQQQAIRLARRKLCDEMPGFYNVIHKIEDREFRIDPAPE